MGQLSLRSAVFGGVLCLGPERLTGQGQVALDATGARVDNARVGQINWPEVAAAQGRKRSGTQSPIILNGLTYTGFSGPGLVTLSQRLQWIRAQHSSNGETWFAMQPYEQVAYCAAASDWSTGGPVFLREGASRRCQAHHGDRATGAGEPRLAYRRSRASCSALLPGWGVHGAACAERLRIQAGTPLRRSTWRKFLRSQAEPKLACDSSLSTASSPCRETLTRSIRHTMQAPSFRSQTFSWPSGHACRRPGRIPSVTLTAVFSRRRDRTADMLAAATSAPCTTHRTPKSLPEPVLDRRGQP
jgi:hypothetical protein